MIALAGLVLVVVLIGLLALGAWTALRPEGSLSSGSSRLPARLPPRDRAWLAESIAHAQWVPAHDEVDGCTRVLVRRTYTGLDGRPAVLDERVLETFPAGDPAWEGRFTEAMSAARFRCTYLNVEEGR